MEAVETMKRARTRTPLGKELAKIRIDRDEDAGEMAVALGVKGPYLSRLEYGSIQPTPDLARKIYEVYGLDVLPLLVGEGGTVTLELAKLSEDDRRLAMTLYSRQLGLPEPTGAPGVTSVKDVPAQPVSAVAAPVRPVRAVEDDVDGVGFIDDDSELDDLDAELL